MERGEKGWKTIKETWEKGLSGALDNGLYCICSYTSYITNLYVDVGKLPNHLKICVLYLFALDQFLLCFIIQTVSNGLRFIVAKVLLLLHFMFLQLSFFYIIVHIWSKIIRRMMMFQKNIEVDNFNIQHIYDLWLMTIYMKVDNFIYQHIYELWLTSIYDLL